MKSPFKFLDSYTKEDSRIFFGRDRETEELYQRVFESKLMLVYGVSGTGKSSLIHCGLANKFSETDWLPLVIRRGSNIINSMAGAIQATSITRQDGQLSSPVQFRKSVKSLYLDHYKPVFFIFDQFEELFIFGDKEERKSFVQIIKSLIESDLQCRLIFVMREEYMAGVTEFERYIPTFFANRVRIEKMAHTNAIEAISGPCKAAGIDLEEGFPEALLERLSPEGADVELTYLQVFLDRIFRLADTNSPFEGGRGGCSFTISLLSQTGNVSDLLGSFLDEQISLLSDPDSALAVLKSFVSVKGTKRQMTSEEVKEYARTLGKQVADSVLTEMLQTFIHLRILREKDQNERYELRHDALATKIYEKITLVEKEILEIRQFIENAWISWQKRRVLISATDLDYIAPYESRLYLPDEQKGLLDKSKNELVKVKKRRRVIAVIGVVFLLIVFAGFTSWALKERNKAIGQSLRAKVLLLVAKAKESTISDPTKAIRYALLAYNKDSTNVYANQTLSDFFYRADSKPFYRVSMEHQGPVSRAVFSPDGRYILTASADNTAKLWDLSGKCIVTFSGHSRAVNSALFSPDGISILTASGDKTAKLWDLSGKCLAILSGHSGSINSSLFSQDSKSIITTSDDKTAKLWDLSGNCQATLSGHSGYVNSARFSPDCKSILTASGDKTAKLWDLSGKCLVTISGHSSYVNSALFSPDGKYILTASVDGTAKLWDLSGKCLATLSVHLSNVRSAVFSADGKSILTASFDKTAKLWDLSGKCLVTLSGHKSQVYSALFAQDGKSILTASGDNTAKLWDLSGKCLATLSGHSSYVYSALFSQDGKSIVTTSDDKTAKLWDISGKSMVAFSGHSGYVSSALFSPYDKTILTASADKTAKLWDLSGKCLVTLSGHSELLYSAVFSTDGRSIITASEDNTVKLWDLSGKCLSTLLGHSSYVNYAIFSPDGRSVLTASMDKTAKLWNLSGKCLFTLSGHSFPVYSALFSRDGRFIITASGDKTAKLWDLSGNCLVTLSRHSDGVNSAIFSPDDKFILTASTDKTAKLWDLSGKCLITLSGHSEYVNSAVFSPDGKYILTASGDKTAKLWDLSGKCLVTLSGHSEYVNSAVFSPDGKYILTASYDQTSKLWDLSGKCLATISGHSAGVLSSVFSADGKYILTASGDKAKLWFTPSSVNKWLSTTQIGSLSPAEKAEIEEPDDFRLIQKSDNLPFITDYADWYLDTQDTAKAVALYKRAMELNPMSIDKRILGDIYRKQKKEEEYSTLYKEIPELAIKEDIYSLQGPRYRYDYSGIFNFCLERSKLYEKLLKTESSLENKIEAASNYNELAWNGLLSGNYNEALKAIQRGIELDSMNNVLYTNLPLCYLMNGKYEKAESLYLEYKDKPYDNQYKTFKEAFLADLKDFESRGITHPGFAKVKELLKK